MVQSHSQPEVGRYLKGLELKLFPVKSRIRPVDGVCLAQLLKRSFEVEVVLESAALPQAINMTNPNKLTKGRIKTSYCWFPLLANTRAIRSLTCFLCGFTSMYLIQESHT